MSVMVDRERLEIENPAIQTVGDLLAHLHKQNRLVTKLLIDGEEPDLSRIGEVRQQALAGRTLFIETTEPQKMALDVLDQVEAQLAESDRLKADAVDLLQRNQPVRAMEKLSGCFSTWQAAQEAVLKVARLLRIDLERIRVAGRAIGALIGEFAGQLRQVKQTLENRDFVTLSDILAYETSQTSNQWRAALGAIRDAISPPSRHGAAIGSR